MTSDPRAERRGESRTHDTHSGRSRVGNRRSPKHLAGVVAVLLVGVCLSVGATAVGAQPVETGVVQQAGIDGPASQFPSSDVGVGTPGQLAVGTADVLIARTAGGPAARVAPDTFAQTNGSIGYNQSVSGALTTNDSSSPEYNGYYDARTFAADANDSVTISMNSAAGDTYLYLVGPNGSVVAQNDDSGESFSLNSTIQRTLSTAGNYTVIATSFDPQATFEYTLSLEQAGAVEGADLRSIGYNESASGALDTNDPSSPEYNGYYEPVTFSADANDSVTITMRSDGDSYLYLVGPNGSVVAENDDSNASFTLDARIQRTLSTAGNYTVIATSFDPQATFEYDLSLERGTSAGAADLRTIGYGQNRSSTLDANDPSTQGGRYFEPVTFSGEAGDSVTITMRSSGDPYLYLIGPNGTVVAQNDDSDASFTLNARIQQTLPTTGSYVIAATSFESGATFEYDLSLTTTATSPDAGGEGSAATVTETADGLPIGTPTTPDTTAGPSTAAATVVGDAPVSAPDTSTQPPTPTDTTTASATPTESTTTGTQTTASDEGTTGGTDGSGAGFGVLAAVFAVVGLALVARRRA